jgi:hypothetical protein
MTTHVVQRCPSCGVEHEGLQVGACEACSAPLRYWCPRHGRETGWLASSACPRCAEEAAGIRVAAPPIAPRVEAAAPPEPAVPVTPAPVPTLPVVPEQPPGFFGRLMVMVFMMGISTFVGGSVFVGVGLVGLVLGLLSGLEAFRITAAAGAVLGALFGLFACVCYALEQRAERRASAPGARA